MCGLVGVVTKYSNGFTTDQKEIFNMLLWIDTFRGDDSTGMFVVDNIGNVKLAKEATYAPRFMASKEYDTLTTDAVRSGWAMVGHNRKATRGTISDANAHPFIVDDNIVLVHNGSYNGDHKGLKDVEVDSLAIAHTISETKDVEQALRKVNAAYALIWYNQEEKTLNLVRNLQRPLWMMEYSSGWVFASEEAFLQLIKHKFKTSQVVKEPAEIKDYHLHQFKLGDSASTKLDVKELDCSYHKHNSNVSVYETHHPFRQSSIANAYGCWEGDGRCDDGDVATFIQKTSSMMYPPVVVKEEPINTRAPQTINRVLDLIAKDCVTLPWKLFESIKEEIPDGTKLKVVINDLTEADANPKTRNFLLVGRTMFNDKVYVTFPVKEENFHKVISSTNDAVFEIEVDGISWHNTESLDLREATRHNMGVWKGITIVHGRNPTPLFTETSHATH